MKSLRKKLSLKTLLPPPILTVAIESYKKYWRAARAEIEALFYAEKLSAEDVPEQVDASEKKQILDDLKRIKRDGLSDNEFFEKIHENPLWLASEPFQEKIHMWQLMARDFPGYGYREKAQERLKQIGSTLAFIGQEKSSGSAGKRLNIITRYAYLLCQLEPIMPELNELPLLEDKKKLFAKKLPRYESYSYLAKDKFSASSLAMTIIEEVHGLSETTIKNYLKESRDLIEELRIASICCSFPESFPDGLSLIYPLADFVMLHSISSCGIDLEYPSKGDSHETIFFDSGVALYFSWHCPSPAG